MIRSIERLRRQLSVSACAPALLLVVSAPTHPDPVGKRATGYAGVIPVPATAATTTSAPSRLDPLLEGRRDTRAERGRVLYGVGHAPSDTAVVRTHRHPCPAANEPTPDQRLVQTNPRTTAPNS
jgi:hypothetical protein